MPDHEDADAQDAYVVTLSSGGQVAIPKFMRKHLKPGERLLMVRHGDGYVMKPVRSVALRAEFDDLRRALGRVVRTAGFTPQSLDQLVAEVRRNRRLRPKGHRP